MQPASQSIITSTECVYFEITSTGLIQIENQNHNSIQVGYNQQKQMLH